MYMHASGAPSFLPSRWYAKDSYGRGAGLNTIAKDLIFKQPYLPVFRMPPSSTISGSEPPPTDPVVNPVQCGAAECISHVGCVTDMAGGVHAVPTPALTNTTMQLCTVVAGIKNCVDYPVVANSGWTALTCAAEAKKNGGSLFAIQVGMWAPDVWGWGVAIFVVDLLATKSL